MRGAAEPLHVDAVWLDGGRLIALITMGSSSAAPYPEGVTARGQHVSIELAIPDVPTTRDWRPRVTMLAVPAGVDPTEDVTLQLSGAVDGVAVLSGRAELASTPPAAATPTDFAPSAAWTSTAGQFILLTWGSSLPPLELETSIATGPREVTVQFAPPATPMATMDLAPRLTFGFVSTPVSRPAVAVLRGRDDLDGTRVAIIG